MEILDMIERLQEEIESATPLFFKGYCVINKEEILQLLQDIQVHFPEDLKQARWITGERERILSEARFEADDIIKSANEQLISMLDENEITIQANERAEAMLKKTKHNADEIKASSYRYSDDLLKQVQRTITNSISDLERIHAIIESNRRELK